MIENPNKGLWWLPVEDTYLAEHYPAGTCIVEMSIRLGRGPGATERRARRLGLKRPVKPRGVLTDANRHLIRERYVDLGPTAIALQINTSPNVVAHYAKRIGIRKAAAARPRDQQRVTTIVRMLRLRNGRRNEMHEYSFRNIGKLLGISHNIVAGIARDVRVGRIDPSRLGVSP